MIEPTREDKLLDSIADPAFSDETLNHLRELFEGDEKALEVIEDARITRDAAAELLAVAAKHGMGAHIMTLEDARRLLDSAIADNRPITRADADACRAVAARLHAQGFKQGALTITDRLAAVRQEATS